jgi:hypothetical protein
MSTNINTQDAFVRPPERHRKANPEFNGPVAERAVTVQELFRRTEGTTGLVDPSIVQAAAVHQLPLQEAPADPYIDHMYAEAPITEPAVMQPAAEPFQQQPAQQPPYVPAPAQMQPVREPVHDNDAFLHGARNLVNASLPAGSIDLRNYAQPDGDASNIVNFPMAGDIYDAGNRAADTGDQNLEAIGYREFQDDAA